ncbi:SDR family NAD(P)-dependent oxidoreductase [Streptomyces klenkii]|uniref:SDR family NAD(P)-dependent oxidoreductase n=1 Tax=Streptomyces klenkii TaxID=1420899 RepID=A0A3B0BQ72_9ACTN|nr:SDR family NAD(P)-dependent oxidoreductase [Streptomyces klenkii]RKN75453.1 SDR family NAD(P)-dependent oxidoreductase [Streptomyces klenkii]
MKIDGSTVLVTGANRGIGRALVSAFLARGARRVHAAARNPAALEPVVAEAPDRVLPLALDLTVPATIDAAAQAASDVTLLVNNAGTHAVGHLLDMDLGAVEDVMRTNCLGTLRVLRAFVPVLERNGGGAVANVISIGAFGGTPSLGGYPASKAALHLMTQAVRADLAPRGIAVHAVFPGPVDTDMLDYVARNEPAFGDFPRAPVAEVAAAVLDGLEAGEEDIFPDAFAAEVGRVWRADPKAVERRLSGIT